MNVIKRNNSKEKFDIEKVKDALTRANECVAEEDRLSSSSFTWVIKAVIDKINSLNAKEIHVENIQDIVEDELIRLNKTNLAKHYIKYRYKQAMARDRYNELMKAVEDKLQANNVQNQNANLDEYSFGGRIGESASLVNKKYAIEYLLSDLSKNNHLNNEIYIHDLDHYATGDHNCMSLPLDDLLANGAKIRQTDIRPAGTVNTALQLVAVYMQLQSLNQFGGVSATHLDWTMVPYVRKSFYKHFLDGLKYVEELSEEEISNFEKQVEEKTVVKLSIDSQLYKKFSKTYKYALDMLEKECYQAVEALYHNLNSLQSRSGNQLPFSSINYGTCTLPEGRMVIKYLLQVSIEGLGKFHRTSIFPCGIFQCMKGVNRKPGDPNYDLFKLALKSTSLRLYPNYANVDWSGNAGYDIKDPRTYFSTMGCRTANGWDINGLGQLKDGRGNICPVTIILPTLAMEAGRNVDTFMELLDTKISEAKDMLIERFEWIASQSPEAAKFMYENRIMAGYIPSEGIRSALKHGTLAVGQLGLAEALILLIGKDQTTKEGMALAKKIEKLFQKRCKEFKEKYKLNFGVYYTPAENLCKTAMEKFKEKYGIIEGVSDKKYFTNSIHVPVYYKINAFDKIDIESQLTGYSSAGCITYVELDSSSVNNIEALETLVNYAMDKDIPYFAINVPSDLCEDCGYQGEMNDVCPQCGSKNIEQLRRVTGYLTGNYKTAFNEGKQQEVEMRVKHTGVEVD